jgi:hypothetical protein
MMIKTRLFSAVAIGVTILWASDVRAADVRFADLEVAVTTAEGWASADAATLKILTQMTAPGIAAHAQRKGASASPNVIDSATLLLCSKLPIGTPGDNPNVILAKEKAWADGFEKSGAGYLKLMQDRVQLLGAPTRFVGEPKETKIGGAVFHQQDAVNTRVPDAPTKQRFICTFQNGYYVYFVFSFNDETDADFRKMMEVVNSFRSLKT